MAASGINEHKEGCRKQRVLDRAARAQQMMLEDEANKESLVPMQAPAADPNAPGYMRKMGSPPGITGSALPASCEMGGEAGASEEVYGSHSPAAIDRLRREGVRAQQLVAYSAKIPNRLSSENYKQQW